MSAEKGSFVGSFFDNDAFCSVGDTAGSFRPEQSVYSRLFESFDKDGTELRLERGRISFERIESISLAVLFFNLTARNLDFSP